jgi:hypothetical protein
MKFKDRYEQIKKYNKEKPFLQYLADFCYKINNTSMFIFSMFGALIGVSLLPNYNIYTLEFLLCLMLTLISYNYMLVYSRR